MTTLSYYTDSEAPRDFRVESTESEGHYAKCPLCYQVKKNFFCPDCIKAGNIMHTSMPYSDRFSQKQMKLLRLKVNRNYILDRCERLLEKKIKRDRLLTEAKRSRDKLDLLRLAIEQRKNNVDERKKELVDLTQNNNELRLKLPRYIKRVASLGRHVQDQRMDLQNKISTYHDQAHSLAALRRSRIRQLIKYIFPLYVSYDASDSIEDMEFVWSDNMEDESPQRSQLHIVAPWIETDSDFSNIQSWVSLHKENQPAAVCPRDVPAQRAAAALALLAQLIALLAWTLDLRAPPLAHLPLSEYYSSRWPESGVWWRARRVCACAATLAQRAALPPPAPLAAPPSAPLSAPPHARALLAVHAIAVAAATDDPMLGRVEGWMTDSIMGQSVGEGPAGAWSWAAVAAACGDLDDDDLEPPEHLCWPEAVEMEEAGSSPPVGAAGGAGAAPTSLVSSAAASLASMFRGWAK